MLCLSNTVLAGKLNLHGKFEKTLMNRTLYKGVSQVKRKQQDMVKHSPPSNTSELPLTGLKRKGSNTVTQQE